ncbi:unnamed protein product [Rangifer tarandus platyrhynchus]|uniref:Reverse transcriptase domain-containing protein n=2 Tax=Rangifer tarandus platyrhynchus TaxID=3082113 RepID=A0ABN8Y1K2_RANTA|nr:unnamed protein product [Rangifer tarandus platyrhynchus]
MQSGKLFHIFLTCYSPYPSASHSKQFAWNSGDPGLIPGSGRSPGEGHGNPPQYSYLKTPMGMSTGSRRVENNCVTNTHILPSLLWTLQTMEPSKDSSKSSLIFDQHFADLFAYNLMIAYNLRYADDTTLMAESEEELKSLLMKVEEETKSWLKTQHSKN